MRKSLFILPLLLTLLLTGCVSSQPPKMRMSMGIPDGKVEYKPVDSSQLELKLISSLDLRADYPGKVIFALINRGDREIIIDEWYTNESDNVVVFAQNIQPGMTAPHPDKWIELSFDLKKPVLHFPLRLMPGNQAVVTKELPFVKDVQLAPGRDRYYFLAGMLNLKSVKLQSEAKVLRVYEPLETEKPASGAHSAK